MELFRPPCRIVHYEMVMRAHLAKLSPRVVMLLAVPAALVAYSIGAFALPALVHALVPDVVRSVLSLL